MFEDPSTSKFAFTMALFTTVCIITSAVVLIIESMPKYYANEYTMMWIIIEGTLVGWFTIEIVARTIAHATTRKTLRDFLLSPSTIIDIVSIIPVYVALGVGGNLDAQGMTEVFRNF